MPEQYRGYQKGELYIRGSIYRSTNVTEIAGMHPCCCVLLPRCSHLNPLSLRRVPYGDQKSNLELLDAMPRGSYYYG
jgi:hypothetical protein